MTTVATKSKELFVICCFVLIIQMLILQNNQSPKSPAFVFMIDVSYNAIKSGLVHLICQRLKDEVLVNLPK
jgi:hypothetical protein